MGLKVERLDLEGLLLARPQKFADSRGYFVETYSARAYKEAGMGRLFVQDNQSFSSRRGTVRGLHFQIPPAAQAKLIRVLRGSVLDVVVDLRQGSPTYGQWRAITLSAEDGAHLFIPVGFAHGFCTLEPNTEVAYKVDDFYSPKCDAGLRWDDPDIGVIWPISAAEAILSDKDANLPPFKTFISPFIM